MTLLSVTLCHILEQNAQNADSKYSLDNIIIWTYFHGSNRVESVVLGKDCFKRQLQVAHWKICHETSDWWCLIYLNKVKKNIWCWQSHTKIDCKYKKAGFLQDLFSCFSLFFKDFPVFLCFSLFFTVCAVFSYFQVEIFNFQVFFYTGFLQILENLENLENLEKPTKFIKVWEKSGKNSGIDESQGKVRFFLYWRLCACTFFHF